MFFCHYTACFWGYIGQPDRYLWVEPDGCAGAPTSIWERVFLVGFSAVILEEALAFLVSVLSKLILVRTFQ